MEQFTKKEIKFLIDLVEAHKGSVSFLRGFGKPTREEQDESAYFNNLIKKLTNYEEEKNRR